MNRRRPPGHGHSHNVNPQTILGSFHDDFAVVSDEFQRADGACNKREYRSFPQLILTSNNYREHFHDLSREITVLGSQPMVFGRVRQRGFGVVKCLYLVRFIMGTHGPFVGFDIFQIVYQASSLFGIGLDRLPVFAGIGINKHDPFPKICKGYPIMLQYNVPVWCAPTGNKSPWC